MLHITKKTLTALKNVLMIWFRLHCFRQKILERENKKNSCKKVNDNILLLKILEFLKFLTEKNIMKKEEQSPKIKE